MPSFRPSYIALYERGELQKRISILNKMLEDCTLCPRNCRVNRTTGDKGFCRIGALPVVSSAQPHFGEERVLVGRYGSGTIFMTGCNMRCVFCQNYDISQLYQGEEVEPKDLSAMMTMLGRLGCHNINFVTPTHQTAQIVAALPAAIENGLDVPLVYNCGGYESAQILKLLEGVFDIYMPDIKYSDDKTAELYSKAPGYYDTVKKAVLEMHRQTGDLVVDKDGVAQSGLIIRHLVLPGGLAGTKEVVRFIAEEVSKDSYVNIMDQYRPCFKASEYKVLNRRLDKDEFDEALGMALGAGLRRISCLIDAPF